MHCGIVFILTRVMAGKFDGIRRPSSAIHPTHCKDIKESGDGTIDEAVFGGAADPGAMRDGDLDDLVAQPAGGPRDVAMHASKFEWQPQCDLPFHDPQ